MVKKIVWTLRAQEDRKKILAYWIHHNKSKTFSIKLNNLFIEQIKLISSFPKIGRLTSDKKARLKVVRNYLIIYEELKEKINILTIWDNRQDPEKLKELLNKLSP